MEGLEVLRCHLEFFFFCKPGSQLGFHSRLDLIVEASLDVLEPVVARKVGIVELYDATGTLVTELKALVAGKGGMHAIADAAGSVVAALPGAVLQVRCGLEGATVVFEEHLLQLQCIRMPYVHLLNLHTASLV